MDSTNSQVREHSERPLAALTPRPIRLLLVGKVWPGRERAVRETQTRFPIDAAQASGIDAIEAYIGSGYYILVLESSSPDMQRTLTSCLDDERVRAFFAQLEPDVEGVPGPEWRFTPGDNFHADAESVDAGPGVGTAALPLAANMYRWRVGQQPEIGEEPHRGAA